MGAQGHFVPCTVVMTRTPTIETVLLSIYQFVSTHPSGTVRRPCKYSTVPYCPILSFNGRQILCEFHAVKAPMDTHPKRPSNTRNPLLLCLFPTSRAPSLLAQQHSRTFTHQRQPRLQSKPLVPSSPCRPPTPPPLPTSHPSSQTINSPLHLGTLRFPSFFLSWLPPTISPPPSP